MAEDESAPGAEASTWRWNIPMNLTAPNMSDFNTMYTIPTGSITFTPTEFPRITGINVTNVGTGHTAKMIPVPEAEANKRIKDLEAQVREQAEHILVLKGRLARVRQVLQLKKAANRISISTMEIEQALGDEE